MYDILMHGAMIADHGRTDAYAQALRARLTPESVVLDIGAGSGILTLLACQAGARRVYAVEPDGIVEVARESAARNGFSDRVELIQAFSTVIDLPEKVDVIVSEIHGPLPYFLGCPSSIVDARDRFLKPGGFLVPMRDTLSVAVVTLPDAYDTIVQPWGSSFGLDCSAGRRRALNTWMRVRCTPAALLVEPRVWSILDYLDVQSPSAEGRASWTITHTCEGHGLSMWFDCETAPGYGFSSSPLPGEEGIFPQVFFPWSEPCKLEAGDRIAVDLRADLVGEDYIWSWNTETRGPDGRGATKAQFRQSEFLGNPMSAEWLRKSGPSFPGFPIWLWYFCPFDQSSSLEFRGFLERHQATEGDTQWVNYKRSPFSSRSTDF